MNVPVKVYLEYLGKTITVLDDELHGLIHEGVLSYARAIAALKDAGLALDKRFYPWLRDIENFASGEFEPPAEAEKDNAAELVSDTTVKAAAKSSKLGETFKPAESKPELETNPEGEQ